MKIGTHNGYFHADEALAIYMLRLLPEYKNAEVVRTRDPAVLDNCEIIVDVGGVYERDNEDSDPSKHRYDHHQREFNDHFDEEHKVTKLSSAGLVYKHFAKRIFKEVYNVSDDETVEYLYTTIYDRFIESMDANDNGVALSDGELKYKISTDLPNRVSRLNPSWKDKEVKDVDERFMKAVELTGQDFDYFVSNELNVILPAKTHLEKALEKRFETHKSGKVIEMIKSCPFSGFLYKHEDEHGLNDKDRVLYYLTFDESSNQWLEGRGNDQVCRRSTCIKEKGTQFKSRLPFPEHLRGLRDENLEKASGIPGLTFIHATGFTCGGKTKVK
ncbi:uncharacterized protein TOT_040000085 [Theileria orientalis strain Shintoku]|uniref:Uncharacterized protein n=1 Tax=Theileria orientalis strain Shintoku TaxID=869250 RepID=J4DQ23_THEOR|nr:uncharacterized protein TOT_040000085 [Theileria orientalis strain Shintoku]BAM41704.1 uncharacterized protein TOT_040000085 [Theileria orientalis strain Shintoku]|eukprot:XP_009692005.1 uncharacterized protein TOT_040000085 [Theileria orientalis strain Shintoku]